MQTNMRRWLLSQCGAIRWLNQYQNYYSNNSRNHLFSSPIATVVIRHEYQMNDRGLMDRKRAGAVYGCLSSTKEKVPTVE
jgi:hypothetical protein